MDLFHEQGRQFRQAAGLLGAAGQQGLTLHGVHHQICRRIRADDPRGGLTHRLLPHQVPPLHKTQRALCPVRIQQVSPHLPPLQIVDLPRRVILLKDLAAGCETPHTAVVPEHPGQILHPRGCLCLHFLHLQQNPQIHACLFCDHTTF